MIYCVAALCGVVLALLLYLLYFMRENSQLHNEVLYLEDKLLRFEIDNIEYNHEKHGSRSVLQWLNKKKLFLF